MKSSRIINWNNRATEYFRKACEHIQNQSYANAERVKMGTIRIIDDPPKNPEKFAPDKFKRNNKWIYSAFEKYSYPVSYKYSESEIRILRVRHVKQAPKDY